jgi:glycosyltransferase involved in cell wall biosynthesis
MGAWLDRVATTSPDGFARRRVVYLGHLVPRQGVEMLLEAISLLDDVSADIVGTGPLEGTLRDRARTLGIVDRVHFHGFVADHRDVERLLAESSVAVAPYAPSADSFTRYADPGKLKAYLAAGLPIVLTDVPPNAHELAEEAGAELAAFEAAAIAAAVARALASPDGWRERRAAALDYGRRFDWARLLPDVLDRLGLNPRTNPQQ